MLERSLYRSPSSRRQRAPVRRRRRHFRNGHRVAVVRAFTAARLYLNGQVPSLASAAEACGSNIRYIAAAVVLLKGDDPSLPDRVIKGWDSLTETANRVRKIVNVEAAVSSWRVWTPEQRAEFGRGAGVADIWDDAIVPTIAEERASQVQAAE
jgi:hypothetical protein